MELDEQLRGKQYPVTEEELAKLKAEIEGRYKDDEDEDGLRDLALQVASDPESLAAYYQAARRTEEIDVTLRAEGFTEFEA